MRRVAGTFAATLTAWAVASLLCGQEAAPVDRTNPEEVARAYVQACKEGNVAAAVELLEPDEKLLDNVREFANSFNEEGGPGGQGITPGDFLLELQLTPLAFSGERTEAAFTKDGDQARMVFHVAHAFDEEIVLTRQPDGTWVVKLFDSVRATTKREASWLEAELGTAPEAEQEVAPVQAEVQRLRATIAAGPQPQSYYAPDTDHLTRLWGATMEYARDHQNRLPAADRWVDELEVYLLDRALLRSPNAPDLPYGYAMNQDVGGREWTALWGDPPAPRDALLFVELPSDRRNATLTGDGLATLEPLEGQDAILYVACSGQIGRAPKGMTFAESEQRRLQPDAMAETMEDGAQQFGWACQQHLMALAEALRRYARQHGGLLPAAATWQDDIAPILLQMEQDLPWIFGGDPAEVLTCPAVPDTKFAYAINEEVAGKNALDLPDHETTVLVYESNLNRPNAAGSPERDGITDRHTSIAGPGPTIWVGYLSGGAGEIPVEGPEERPAPAGGRAE